MNWMWVLFPYRNKIHFSPTENLEYSSILKLVNINSKTSSRVTHSEKAFVYYSATKTEYRERSTRCTFLSLLKIKINDGELGGSIAITISKEFATACKKCHTTETLILILIFSTCIWYLVYMGLTFKLFNTK